MQALNNATCKAYIKYCKREKSRDGGNMYNLKYADYEGNYHGFSLKKGYYYGEDTETGEPIATSGWCSEGAVALYFLTDGKWKKQWINIEENIEYFSITNLPENNTMDKIPFDEWLEEEKGITYNEWDEVYSASDSFRMEIETEYDKYYYDDLPEFVITYLSNGL